MLCCSRLVYRVERLNTYTARTVCQNREDWHFYLGRLSNTVRVFYGE